jgi:hypothetical protein
VILDFAEVLSLAHRPLEAVEAVRRALDLFEQKGNRASIENARSMLVKLEPA